jgi:GH25 family lysozyme M1 (1,4-beta-N-acetylmuramidase)
MRALMLAVVLLPALPAHVALAATTDYLANCPINLRSTASTSADIVAVIATGTDVSASGTVSGGSWTADCPSTLSGSSWYAITAVGGTSVQSLYGVATVYAATGLFRPATVGAVIEGIDVSHWQGTIDWAKVATSNKRFAIMKASQGTIYTDSQYATNHAAARAVGIRTAAYHFASPTTGANDAVLQADWFLSKAALMTGDLVPALDLETSGGLSTSALQAWVGAWLGEVYAKSGIRPMIYTSPSFWKNYMGNTTSYADAGYTVLWVAHWFVGSPTVPANNWGGRGWTFWQYDDCGSVPGISGCVDLDRFNGTDLTAVTYRADYALSATPSSASVKQGVATSFSVSISRNFFTLPISLSVTGLPPGAAASLSATSVSGSSASFNVATSRTGTVTPVGSYPLTITGSSNGLSRTATATLVVTDGIGPTVNAPVSRLFSPATMGATTMPVRTLWSASDPSGIAYYVVQRQANDGSWSVVNLSSPTATSVTQALTFGTAYRFVTRAVDGAVNGSGWAYGQRFRPLLAQQSSGAISYGGAWTTATNSNASGGSLRYATAKGASATYAFTGSSVSWIAYRGPNRGSAAVYVDGTLRATVNLNAPYYHSKAVAYAFNWTVNGAHTLKIVCLGTAGHARIDVDAFVRLYQG